MGVSMQLSSLVRLVSRPWHVPGLSAIEDRLVRKLSPGDWCIAGIFFVLMAFGVAAMLAAASVTLSTEVPAHGGTHTEGVVGTPRFINPLLAISDTDRDLTQLTYAGLMKDTPGGLVPDLASGYTVSDDGRTYTFTLADVSFSDGTPVTADDVAYTIQMAQNPDLKSPVRPNWEGVTVTATDLHTVVFTLKSPYGPFLENATLGILPKHLWSAVKAEEFPFSALNLSPVGAGPYTVESVKKNKSGVPTEATLAAFSRAHVVPYITHMVFRFYQSAEEARTALMAHDIDAAHSVVPEVVRGTVLHEATYTRVFGVFFNQNENKVFADQSVRAALDRALDKNALIDTILSGYGSPIDGPLPQASTKDATEDAATRLEAARAILVKDGWKLDTATSSSEGALPIFTKSVKSGKGAAQVTRLAFTLTTGSAPELKRAAEAVASAWRTLGADVTLQFFDQNDLNLTIIRPRAYQSLLFGEVVGREPDLFAFWHSSQRNDPGLNIALYTNSTVDKLLASARTESNPALRRSGTESAAAIIENETAAVFLYAPSFIYRTEDRLQGVTLGAIATPSDRFIGVERWYVETERVWPIFAP